MFKTSLLKQLFSRNKRMIAGNWKSNKTYSEALDFVKNTINNIQFNPNNVGNLPYIQMSSSLLSLSIFQAFLHSILATNYTTESQLRTVPTTAMVHTLAKSVPNISKMSACSGSFWVTLKEELSLERIVS